MSVSSSTLQDRDVSEAPLSPAARFRALPANLRGALWLVLGALIFSAVGVFIRYAGREIDALQLSFFRGAIGLVFIVPLLIRQRVNPFRSPRPGLHFIRAALGTTAMVCGFYATTNLPLADATSISFSQPLFVTMLAALFMGEVVRWRRWSATIVGFAGVVVMMRPGAGSFQAAMLIALAGTFAGACSTMLVKKMSAHDGPLAIVGSIAILQTIFLLPPALLVWQWPSPTVWLYVLGIGLCATVGQYCWIRAYSAGEASAIAPFDYVRLPLSIGAGVWLFAEVPTVWTAVGTAIIVCSTAYIAHREATLGKTLPGAVKAQKTPA